MSVLGYMVSSFNQSCEINHLTPVTHWKKEALEENIDRFDIDIFLHNVDGAQTSPAYKLQRQTWVFSLASSFLIGNIRKNWMDLEDLQILGHGRTKQFMCLSPGIKNWIQAASSLEPSHGIWLSSSAIFWVRKDTTISKLVSTQFSLFRDQLIPSVYTCVVGLS